MPVEALAALRRRLVALPARHPERSILMASTAQLYAVSRATLYRLLRGDRRPKDAHRADRGRPRAMPAAEVERWCEIVAAMKVRTTNRKGRHLSTVRTLQLLVEHGVDTPDGFQKLAPGKLTASTVNRHLRRLGYDHERMTRQPPAVRFQAECANALWHFDMSPSDLKHLKAPPWIDADRQGAPTLMLFSVVDDRSGVAYQEYRCVYGEDVETALRFLFNAMSPKQPEAGDEADPFHGIPTTIYLDNGPVAKSAVFKRVMESLGVEILPHMPAGSDGRRTTARAKGKVERPFRTVKEAHETLYHFHEPETEAEANRWLARFIATYNRGDHRSEPHARIDDWLTHLPADGVRQMCAWERFCAFAREPERRLVGLDCRLTVAGVTYEVDADLAGETVVVWWGLFDQELWVEHGEERMGPFRPAGGPIPLHRYRKHRKSRHEVHADQVAALAATAVYPTNVAPATARVRLRSDGDVLVQSASQEIGTGIRTVAGQMAAEQLGVSFEQVKVEMGDTNLPPAPVSGGSNSTASVCSAVLIACRQIQDRLFSAAVASNSGPLAGRNPADLAIRSGEVVAKDGASQKLRNVFGLLHAGAIEEYAEFIPDAVQKLYEGKFAMTGGPGGKTAKYAYGAEFVEVRINARTGEIRVPRLVGAFAAGRIMNTRTARSQLMGGLIWGMSAALLEATEIDERTARTVNRDLQDYFIPVNADVQEVQVILLPEVDHEVNPAGVKGIGELGNAGTNAAVANAVFHATGKRIRNLPIRLEHLLA